MRRSIRGAVRAFMGSGPLRGPESHPFQWGAPYRRLSALLFYVHRFRAFSNSSFVVASRPTCRYLRRFRHRRLL